MGEKQRIDMDRERERERERERMRQSLHNPVIETGNEKD